MIEVVPVPGKTWKDVYAQLRTSPKLEDVEKVIGVCKERLWMEVDRSADALTLTERIQTVLVEAGSAETITQMDELVISSIDSIAKESDVRIAVEEFLGIRGSWMQISMWERRDGTQRARVRLPIKPAALLVGQRVAVLHILLHILQSWTSSIPHGSHTLL
uniref:Uncharacterized protein n=1 Tax=Anopheles maculatus TaxID=74869 RepID=A0A182STR1_9DIPT